MSAPIYLNDLGVVCALGAGRAAVTSALFADAPGGLSDNDSLLPGRTLALGEVRTPLPALDDLPVALRGRNNALLDVALAQIAPAVAAAIARHGAERVAVVLGTSTSGIGESEQALRSHAEQGQWPQGFDYAQQEMGTAAQFVRQRSGAQGPAWTLSTACSSSAKALMSAARMLRAGIVDAVIAGGADSLCRFTVAGFSALESVSAQRCNPFSQHRTGINIGEGAALFLLTREPGPVCLAGWGESADAHHMSAPEAELVVPEAGLFVEDDQVPAWVGIEYMAQAIAAWAGCRARAAGRPPQLGFLLGSRRYSSARSSFPSGSRLRVQARCELLGDNGLGMFACRILAGEEEWATANVSVFEPADAMAYLESGQA
ncbi:beta-ketoacyl synthase N-terminal-like domain-containing protein [Stenotrophomonas sepilia]|uniref:ApeP family dehydratase n=1 Tax=Stenotrophomonas sepilia TaxID=2860290 RepID=UPI002FE65156